MKNFALKFMGLGLVLVALFFASCEDETPMVDPLGPDVSLVNEPGFLDVDSDVIINENFSVRLRISKGDADLQSVEITDGSGTKVPTERFLVDGAAAVANPFLIAGAAVEGVTYDITIISSGTEQVGDVTTYTFTAGDAAGETDATDIVITTAAIPGTPITTTIMGALLNQAGPAGQGGLDLDAAEGTGSAAATAEIRDLGIDCDLPGSSNWRQQIGTVNGAVMVQVDPSQLENFTFDNIDKVEPIIEAYNTGVVLLDGESDNCTTPVTVTNVSDAVTGGEMFVVFANDTYYLIQIDSVNPTSGDNMDSYSISIKY